MIRAAFRWLETVPVVGPQLSRAKPLARPVVDLVDRLRNSLVHLRLPAWRLRPMDCWQRWVAEQRSYDNWTAVEPMRPLLNETLGPFSVRRRLQRCWLRIFLALPDRHYRRIFAVLDRKIAAGCAAGAAASPRTGILMVAGGLGPGGAERQLVTTIKGLASSGAALSGLAWLDPTNPQERFFLPELQSCGIPVYAIGQESGDAIVPGVARALGILPPELRPVTLYAATFAAKRPALVHLWLDEPNIMGGIAAVATGVPRVILGQRSAPPYNFIFHQPYMREAYRWLARQPGVSLVNNSHAGARAYERWLGLPKGTIGCIHNGFRFDESLLERYLAGRGGYRARLGIPLDAPLIGGVFRMSEEKRPLLWLEIAAAVRRAIPQAHFLVVGGGPLREEMERRSAADDLAGAVHYAGYERDVLAAIADMDLFLLSSRIEGLPNVLIEAQALGVPVVTMRVGGAPETLVEGVTGLVLKRANPDTAAAAIVRLLRDQNRLSEMRRQGSVFVRSAFAIERNLAETVGLYRAGCGMRQPPARRFLRTLRAAFRRLERVPIIGRQVTRLRPVLYLMVRVRNALISLRHGSGARFKDGADGVRLLLSVRPLHYLWLAVAPLRPLLAEAPARLGYRRRWQRRLLTIFLALPDPLYRRALAPFDRTLRTVLAGRTADRSRTGILMLIGALGAGGAERQFVVTLKELKSRGARLLGVAWLNPPAPEARFFLPELQHAGIPVRTIGDAAAEAIDPDIIRAIEALSVDLHAVRDYAATFAAMRPAVAHLWLDEINVRGGIAAVATGVPRIILGLRNVPPHNFVFHHPYMREGYRWLARQPGVTLVNNSQAGARAYEAWLGLSEGAIGCIHNGFRFDETVLGEYRAGRGSYRSRIGIPADAPLVGGVFRLAEEKRPLLWLDIAAAVRRALPAARFLVAGGGPLQDAMERRAAAADLAGAVHFAGYERDVLGAMADMDLFLLASRLEGLPNVLVEAQALGVPVVTMKVGGAPETVVDGLTGIVLPDDDPENAAAVVAKTLLDAEWRREASLQARAFVANTFSVERMVDAYTRLYQDCERTCLHQ